MKRISFNLPRHAHYLTFSCYRSQPLLTDGTLCRQLLACWHQARQKGDFAIWAYVIMPEHVHLLVWPKHEEYEMSFILRALKESFARWVVEYWSSVDPKKIERIRRADTGALHRFWQKGGGYDRNLYKWESILKVIEYIEANPVRRGLVSEPCAWPWSSARCRLASHGVPFVVDPIKIGHPEAL